ncbi:hypothetical protein ACP70R_041857 [Stipagrostis hirtigluma subsp. patula]
MADRYRAYAPPSSLDRDPRVDYPSYLPPEHTLASYYASRPAVLAGGPDMVPLQSRAYGLDAPAGVINPVLPGPSGLAGGARAGVPSALENPALAGLHGLDPVRARGPSPLEDPAIVSSSIGKSVAIPDVEHHSPLSNLDGPSEDESNILFVDGLPTDCTRREVAHSGDKAYVLCFVEFENAKNAFTAMEALQEYRFDDRKPDAPVLKIQFARFPFRLPSAQDDRRRLSVH